MYSGEGERVNFVKPIDPVNKNVEDWMNEVEEMMKRSVRQALSNCVFDYPVVNESYTIPKTAKKTRVEWVKSHPG
jgi:dynein heavy chain, axonemal